MKKKYIVIISLIIIIIVTTITLFFSVYNKEPNYNINFLITEFEYNSVVKLSDVISVIDGNLINDDTVATRQLGENVVEFEYNVKSRKFTGELKYNVVDTIEPLLISKTNFYTELNKEIDIIDSVMCADNYDSNPTCVVSGSYDINTVGSYNLVITNTDNSNNSVSKDIVLNVYEPIENSENKENEVTPIYLQDIINSHKIDNTSIGIDVSKWQGDIDFNQVKAAGVEFVIIRIGYGYDSDNYLDPKFTEYFEACKEVGLEVGVYYYSYAASVDESIKQAKWIVDTLDKSKLDLPIFFDWEEWHNFNDFDISLTELNDMANSFIETVEKHGYIGGNYSSANYLRLIWELNTPTWLAHYTTNTDYDGDYYIWQLTDKGIVPGIGGYSDINVLYKEK